MIIVIFSSTEGATRFFSQAIDSCRKKFGKNLYLALSGEITKKSKAEANFVSDDLEKILQWSQTVFETFQNQ